LLDCSGQVPRAPGLPKDLRAAFPLRHSAGALYQAFPACEVRRVLRRLEFHYVPKHASWLNMVEIEIGVLRGHAWIDASPHRRSSCQKSLPGNDSAIL
jgi:hypothetical protein